MEIRREELELSPFDLTFTRESTRGLECRVASAHQSINALHRDLECIASKLSWTTLEANRIKASYLETQSKLDDAERAASHLLQMMQLANEEISSVSIIHAGC